MSSDKEPNDYYRPWLEKYIGIQGVDWQWNLCGTDIDMLEIIFVKSEDAILFELKWQ